jgi:hypothetical protein
MIPVTRITCPSCQTIHAEQLPPHRRRRRYYVCSACQSVLQARSQDCCVYCAFGHVPCLQAQAVADLQNRIYQHEQASKGKVS